MSKWGIGPTGSGRSILKRNKPAIKNPDDVKTLHKQLVQLDLYPRADLEVPVNHNDFEAIL